MPYATGKESSFHYLITRKKTFNIPPRYFNLLFFSTHLYGRRLVLEWAEQEETVDDLRRKTANSFTGISDSSQNGPPAKRAKTKSAIAETLQTL